jgi:hypothetical protein
MFAANIAVALLVDALVLWLLLGPAPAQSNYRCPGFRAGAASRL